MTVVVASIGVIAAVYFTWCAHRLRRLRLRTAAAAWVLDRERLRRAHCVLSCVSGQHQQSVQEVRDAAHAVLLAPFENASDAESALVRAVEAAHADAFTEVDRAHIMKAHRRMLIARQLYNDAVRNTVALRTHRSLRLLRLPDPHPSPEYFDTVTTLRL